ncbi:uncharacterized protein SCHCODRAFT_02686461 [Schizophyllum commune H4-8]|nr:uncharacterized protein SCHCODRAFT_02686461 [Schizophyllum commune H4-8]KAI5894990.1 hypothetical protein SCHCODRAFT_02686461 [Schizophyllum commune H4-8]
MPPTRSTKNTSGDASGDRKGRTGSSKRKDPNAAKRPSNQYIHFRSDYIKKQKDLGVEGAIQTDISKAASAAWRALPAEERAVYVQRAKAEAKQHKERYPDFKYNRTRDASSKASSSTSTAPPKRKHRPARRDQPAGIEGAGIVINQVAQDAPRGSAEQPKNDGDSVRGYPYSHTPQALAYPSTPSDFGLPTPSPSPFNSNAYTPFTSGPYVPVNLAMYGPPPSGLYTPPHSTVHTPLYSGIHTPSRSGAPTPSPIPMAHVPLSSPRAYPAPSPSPWALPTPSPSAYAVTPLPSAYPGTPSSDWCPTAPASPASWTPMASPANSGIVYLPPTPETYAVQHAFYPVQDASYSARSASYTVQQTHYDPKAAPYAQYNNHDASSSAQGASSSAHGVTHPGQNASHSTKAASCAAASWHLRGTSYYGNEAFATSQQTPTTVQQAPSAVQDTSCIIQDGCSAVQGASSIVRDASSVAQTASNADQSASCSAQTTSSSTQDASGTTQTASNALLLTLDERTSDASDGDCAQDGLQYNSTYTGEGVLSSAEDAPNDDLAAIIDLNALLADLGATAQDDSQAATAEATPAHDLDGSAGPTSEPYPATSAQDEASVPNDKNLGGPDDLYTAVQSEGWEPMLPDQYTLDLAGLDFTFGERVSTFMT